jgi:hypothetical protein
VCSCQCSLNDVASGMQMLLLYTLQDLKQCLIVQHHAPSIYPHMCAAVSAALYNAVKITGGGAVRGQLAVNAL